MPFIKKKEEANLYSVVTSIFPMTPELTQWSDEKFVEVYRFCKLFINPETKKWTFTKDRVTEVIARYIDSDTNVFFKEFLYRINDTEAPAFRMRCIKLARIVGLYLRRNPAYITDTITAEVKDYTMFAWILEGYEMKTMQSGIEMLVPVAMEQTHPGNNVPIKAKSPEQIYMEALSRTASIFNELTKSVTPGQIKKMKTEKKLDMIPKYMGALASAVKAQKGTSKVFIALNTDSESRQDLEDRLLRYADEQQQEVD